MPARKKGLAALVHDRTFLARRHAQLLVDDRFVPDDLELRTLQVKFRAETSVLERQALARSFEQLVRNRPRDDLTLQQGLLAGLGPPGWLDLSPARRRDLEERWQRWDSRHGFAWRVAHDEMHNQDRIKAYKRLTGRRETNLGRIDDAMPDLSERARTELTLPQAPNPPGWALVSQKPAKPTRCRARAAAARRRRTAG